MLERDSQTLTISRQGLLLVTAMGVGLLTLVYVLGVQVGKQSASMRRANSQASGEELTKLPTPLSEQLKPFEANAPAEKPAPKPEAPAPQPAAAEAVAPKPEPKPDSKPEPKPEPKVEPKPKPETKPKEAAKAKPETPGKWTLQLVSTTDADEAARIAAKAKAAGYTTVIVKDKKLHKVRLVKASSKESADHAATAVKAKGFKPFPVKVD